MPSYQSLYRRYRSQTFAEVLDQTHVTSALRNAVRSERVAHAYLFSGPRGTGKTSTARILAKALNCTNLMDGEPCGLCDSCVQVAAGSSLDVTELDAASNNGVEAMRELVSRASLGTAGRRKVYIVDEVHMLSTAASNALLKTLEEPPDHVVFVLATTDPQKVLPTIRSRTQHFEFHLLALDVLVEHLRFINVDAGLGLDDDTLLAVARRGNGSARDALSALDQAAAAGGLDTRIGSVDDILDAVAAADTAVAIEAVSALMDRGRDPRQLGRDLIEALREGFLALMAPKPGTGRTVDRARTMGPAATVRAIEVLGDAGISMRESLDPRVVLEVALIKLVRVDLDTSPAAILARLERLERGGPPPSGGAPPSPAPGPTPAPTPTPTPTPPAPATPPPPSSDPSASSRTGPAASARAALASVSAPAGAKAASSRLAGSGSRLPSAAPVKAAPSSAAVDAPAGPLVTLKDAWLAEVRSRITVAMFRAGHFMSVADDVAVFALPNQMTCAKCEERRAEVEPVLATVLGRAVALQLVVGADHSGPMPTDSSEPMTASAAGARPEGVGRPGEHRSAAAERNPNVTSDPHHGIPADDDVDVDDLRDAPSAPVASPIDVMLSAFPGAELVQE